MKKILLTGLIVGVLLLGCETSYNSKADASIPSGYELVTETEINRYVTVYEIKNKETGCYMTVVQGHGNGTPVAVENQGEIISRCDKINKSKIPHD